MHTYESAYIRGFLYTCAGLIFRTYSDFQKPKQSKFSAFMLGFETNLTSSGDHSKPFFHTIKRLTWYIFKTHKNPMGKH